MERAGAEEKRLRPRYFARIRDTYGNLKGGVPRAYAFHCGVISLESHNIQDAIADEIIELANKLAEANPDTEPWEISDGILSGAVHWWLYANTPCDNPSCENCASIRTAELRMQTLRTLITEMAETSEYIQSPNDTTVARH